jgi:hypothetical protein
MSTEAFQDSDVMPFGKHKGTKMEDVPASYLHWLYHQCKNNGCSNPDTWKVFNYIVNSKAALMQETKNLIWD